MTFEQAFVTKKLYELQEYHHELEVLLRASDEEILADSGKIHIAERLLQLIVDTMIDVNQHFIKEQHLPVTEDYQSTFRVLAEHTILPHEFAEKLAPVVGLRNIVVHRYEQLDKKQFIQLLRKNSDDFLRYYHEIGGKIEISEKYKPHP